MATKSHVVVPGSKRAKDPDAKRIGPVDPDETFDVTLDLRSPKLPGPNELLNKAMTPAELLNDYGASPQDADKVAKSLQKFGLKVDSVSLATHSMKVSGTAAAMQAAFKAGLSEMRSPDQGEYRGRTGTYSIPTELKGIVKSVLGLDERRMARRESRVARHGVVRHGVARHGHAVPGHAADAASLAPLTPADLEQRYNFPPGDGAGQSIAIAEFGGGYFADDAAAYSNKFGRPVAAIKAVSVDAPAYTLQQILALPKQQRDEELGTSVEVMMDAQIIAGLCPAADISIYFSPFDQGGWVDLLNAVIAAKPVVLSISWGLAEDDPGWAANAIAAVNERLNLLRMLGITTCISSGDDGSGDQIDDGNAHVDFPSCSQFVLSVGGTMLTATGAGVDEVTWWDAPGRRTNDGGGATGGGVSVKFLRPDWQTVRVASLNTGSIDGRVMPDVAALSGQPFYDLIFSGASAPNGGTSASAPLWAALIARVAAQLPPDKRQRFLTPLLYQNGAGGQPIGQIASRDIVSGDNTSTPPGKGYKAGKGFDAVTGWGVPDGVKLLNALRTI